MDTKSGAGEDRPARVAPKDFRAVLGRFATGVVVVAADVAGTPHGLAVNSFSSVSLEPPLVSFCADCKSSTWPSLRRADGFAVSILREDQEHVCRTFATKGIDRFAQLSWSTSPSGHPVLDGALAWLDCEYHEVLPAGDHELVLGRVTSLDASSDAGPLLFFGGHFHAMLPALPVAPRERAAERTVDEALAELHGLDIASPFFSVLADRLSGGQATPAVSPAAAARPERPSP